MPSDIIYECIYISLSFSPQDSLYIYYIRLLHCVVFCLHVWCPPHLPSKKVSFLSSEKKCHLFLRVPRTQHRAWPLHGNSVIMELINKWKRMSKRRRPEWRSKLYFSFPWKIRHQITRTVLTQRASQVAQGWEIHCQCRRGKRLVFHPWVGEIPWRRKWRPTPGFLPGKSHGPRSLVGHGGHKHLDTTEQLSTHIDPEPSRIGQKLLNSNSSQNAL